MQNAAAVLNTPANLAAFRTSQVCRMHIFTPADHNKQDAALIHLSKMSCAQAGYLWRKSKLQYVVAWQGILSPLTLSLVVQVLTGTGLQALLGSQTDRIPDLVVLPTQGTLYTTSLTKVSDHGG